MSECDHKDLVSANRDLARSIGEMATKFEKNSDRITQALGGAIVLGFIVGVLIGGILALVVIA